MQVRIRAAVALTNTRARVRVGGDARSSVWPENKGLRGNLQTNNNYNNNRSSRWPANGEGEKKMKKKIKRLMGFFHAFSHFAYDKNTHSVRFSARSCTCRCCARVASDVESPTEIKIDFE